MAINECEDERQSQKNMKIITEGMRPRKRYSYANISEVYTYRLTHVDSSPSI